MQIVLLTLGILGAFFILMSVKLIFKKDGKFEGTCASQSPFLNPEGKTCSFCGNDPSECKNKKKSA